MGTVEKPQSDNNYLNQHFRNYIEELRDSLEEGESILKETLFLILPTGLNQELKKEILTNIEYVTGEMRRVLEKGEKV